MTPTDERTDTLPRQDLTDNELRQDITEPGTGHDLVTADEAKDVEPGDLVPTIWVQPIRRSIPATEALPRSTVGESTPPYCSLLTDSPGQEPGSSRPDEVGDEVPSNSRNDQVASKADAVDGPSRIDDVPSSSTRNDEVVGDQGCQTDWSLLPRKGEGDMVWELLQSLRNPSQTGSTCSDGALGFKRSGEERHHRECASTRSYL